MARLQQVITYLDEDGKPVKTVMFVGNAADDPDMQTIEINVLPMDTYATRFAEAEAEAEAAYEA